MEGVWEQQLEPCTTSSLHNHYLIELPYEWLAGFNWSVSVHPNVGVALGLDHKFHNAQHLLTHTPHNDIVQSLGTLCANTITCNNEVSYF